MQITFRMAEGEMNHANAVVTKTLAAVLPEVRPDKTIIKHLAAERVAGDNTKAFMVVLPGDVSKERADAFLKALRAEERVESAEHTE